MNNKTRQKELKALGYYHEKIDGKSSKEFTKAILAIQKDYFPKRYQDGIPGPQTDKLIQSAYNCRDIKNFNLKEFRCPCGHCTGYPAVLNRQLLLNLQSLRKNNGSITVTSGLRCQWYNSRLVGSITRSKHTQGKAADIYNRNPTSTFAKRNALVKSWYRYKKANYAYANTPNMGNAVHVDVK